MSFLTTNEIKATGGSITITAAGAKDEVVKVFMSDCILGLYTVQQDDTVSLIAAGLRNAINSDTSRHGYNVSGSGAEILLIAPDGLGSSINDSGLTFSSSGTTNATVVQFTGGTSSDYNQAMYAEILNAITRNNQEIKVNAEKTAISKIEGYLAARYDTASIFSQSGINRHPLIVEIAIDIALYNMHAVSNPENIPDLRVKRYDDAIKILNNIQGLKINPVGLPLSTNTETNYIKYGGREKTSLRY